MDVIYTLNQLGFNVEDKTESKDMLYWYSAYLKDKEKNKKDKQNAKKIIVKR